MDSQVNIVIAGSVVRALRDYEKGKHGQPSQHCDCRKCSESIEGPREGLTWTAKSTLWLQEV